MDTFQRNIEAISRHKPELLQIAQNTTAAPPTCTLVLTPGSFPNLLFQPSAASSFPAYSDSDPWADAEKHLHTVTAGAKGLAFFLGMGLGYGPLLVLRERPALDKIIILEPSSELFRLALEAMDLTPLITSDKVSFFVGSIDWQQLEKVATMYAAMNDTFILHHKPSANWQPELYKSATDRAFTILNKINIGGATSIAFGETFIRNRLQNLSLTRHSHNLETLGNHFSGIPAILVASGPSLTQSLPVLKKMQGRCIIISVDGALAPLHQAGITPDFVTAIDIKEFSLEKVAPFLQQENTFFLACNYKVTPAIPKRLPCRHVFFAKENSTSEFWFAEPLGATVNAPNMSSVAHMSLGLALIAGADPIVFIGQDLSYPTAKTKHAQGVINVLPGEKEGTFKVPGLDGGEVISDRALHEIRSRLEEEIQKYPERHFINATAHGAHIAGTETMPLAEVDHKFCTRQLDIPADIRKALDQAGPMPAHRLIKTLHTTIRSIETLTRKLTRSRRLLTELRQELSHSPAPDQIRSHSDLPLQFRARLEKFNQANREIENARPIWFHISELTYPHLSSNERQKAANEQKKKTGDYHGWLLAELDRIDTVFAIQHKTLNRYCPWLEELATFLVAEKKLGKDAAPAKKTSLASQIKLINLYLQTENYRLAAQAAKDALARWPEQASLHLCLGTAQIHLLDFIQAETNFQNACNLEPSCTAEVLAQKEKAALGWLGHIEKYGSSRPNFCRQWLSRAIILGGDRRMVLNKLHETWEKDRENLQNALDHADMEQLNQHLASWEPVNDMVPEWHIFNARKLIYEKNHNEAIAAVSAALKAIPREGQWLALLARLFIETGRYEKGIQKLSEAVSLDPSTAVLWEELGDILQAQQDYANAISAYEHCFLALPDRLNVLAKMGEAYLRNQQPEAAAAAFAALLSKDADNARARQGLASCQALLPRESGPEQQTQPQPIESLQSSDQTKLLVRMLHNYQLAGGELEKNSLHQSPHWQTINEQVSAYFRQPELWLDFRRNIISQGMDDANPHRGLSLPPDLRKSLEDASEQLAKHLDPQLLEQLEESPVGNPVTIAIRGKNLTLSILHYVYFTWRISWSLGHNRHSPLIFLEIGGGIGALARILKNIFPEAKFMLFDLPEANAISTYYLQQNFPDAKLYLLEDMRRGVPLNWQRHDFAILPGWCMSEVAPLSIDYVINTRSMMEMTLEAIAFYFTEIQRVLKPGGLFYCVNRYNKKIGDKEIILADYPYDSLWQFIFSQPKWLQPHIHELIARRLASPNPDFPHPVLMNLSRETGLNSTRQ